jgi:heme/copper-type cytochrome/quinol oxidase subunit 2
MRRLLKNRVALALIAVALCLVLQSVAAACPNCKEAMEKQDPTHGGVVKGYFYSILFMMGTPYLVLGSFCAMMYYRVRKARRSGQPPKRARAGTIAQEAGPRATAAREPETEPAESA